MQPGHPLLMKKTGTAGERSSTTTGIVSVHTQGQRNRQDPETSDGVLVQKALAGDQEAFEGLLSRYEKVLFDVIYFYVGEYHEAHDVLQQVWLQLYLSLHPLLQAALCNTTRHVGREPFQAILIEAASCNPNSSIDVWRIRNFWILPVTVIGKLSTNLI